MKFLRLELKNLASLDRAEGEVIDFEQGALADSTIFSIVGPTGSGKSTLLDAICLALYNRAPRYPRRHGDRNQSIEVYGSPDADEKNRPAPTDCRNILTHGKKEGYSKLTFLANNGSVYRAEWHVRFQRVRYEKSITALYRITTGPDGKPVEQEADWDELPRIIGLDYEQFLRTVLIAQGSFANFLTAKENERYELLEKLIGCEETYTRIAAEISKARKAADEELLAVKAEISAYANDDLTQEQLADLTARIATLKARAEQVKAQLQATLKALEWYATEARLTGNVATYTTAVAKAEQAVTDAAPRAARLAMHDATTDTVALLRQIDTHRQSVESLRREFADYQARAQSNQKELDSQALRLEELKAAQQQAAERLDNQRPHINRARTIKGELTQAEQTSKDAAATTTRAESAVKDAAKAISDNTKAISRLQKQAAEADAALQALRRTIATRHAELQAAATEADKAHALVAKQVAGTDSRALQQAKSAADSAVNALSDAIRVRSEITRRRSVLAANAKAAADLTARVKAIATEMAGFTINALTAETDTLQRTFTLMTSAEWHRHRSLLTDGSPCPLCGATVHPYGGDADTSTVEHSLKQLLDGKRQLLKEQTDRRNALANEKSVAESRLDALLMDDGKLRGELDNLQAQWRDIAAARPDWPANEQQLAALKPALTLESDRADKALAAYATLVGEMQKLEKAKTEANRALTDHTAKAEESVKSAEQKLNDATAALRAEAGKTETLTARHTEKQSELALALERRSQSADRVTALQRALTEEIGTADPDELEKNLTARKDAADRDVNLANERMGRLRETLQSISGRMAAIVKSTSGHQSQADELALALTRRIAEYNGLHPDGPPVTEEFIREMLTATDRWDNLRRELAALTEELTRARTTLANEQTALNAHLLSRPEQTQQQLTELRAELEAHSTAELVESQARMQRYVTARQKMGHMHAVKQQAELRANDWNEISDAIGGADGKTLRKIAQCYTLRFLISHANAEIRKFNSRYELMQVKNSLGIRVIDHDRTDHVRDTTSLSGGETFIVSLGLALGLSALSSRNISFQNLFIDEGFGTLDPDTLATVIDSLSMLQSSQGKKVGVISHTDTMSERITTQIRIIKHGNSGSSHIEIHP